MSETVKVTYKCKCGSSDYEVADWYVSTINFTVENGEISTQDACDHQHDAIQKVTINCFSCKKTTRLKGVRSRSILSRNTKLKKVKDDMAVTLCRRAEPKDPDHIAFEEFSDKEFVPLGAPMVAWRADPDGKFVNYDDPVVNSHHKTWNAAISYVMKLADSRAMDQIHYDWQKVNDVINRMRRFQIVLEKRINALRDAITSNTSRRSFKEDGLWFMPHSDKGASGFAEQISAPVSQLYDALEATSGDIDDVHTRAVDIRDFSPHTLEKVRRALTLAGCALPPSEEAFNAEIERYVNLLASALVGHIGKQKE